MGAALSRHHSLLERSITAHGGYVFQIIGDAFCAAFSTAGAGLQAALDAQRALAAEEWGEIRAIRVRMALHAGNAQVKVGDYTSGEYASGLTLSRAARLLSASHGGQILLSQPVYELVCDHLVNGVTLCDLGSHRLKDLERPEHIYQVESPDLIQKFPPLKTLDARPNNLPAQLTNFIGREQQLEQIKQMLAQNRLVTLTGPGGAGKTRLSLQVGAELIESFEHGIWLVELATISDGSLIPQSLASVVGLSEEPGTALIDSLVKFMRDKQLLLILDNCEHLNEECAQLASKLTRAAPRLKILASSRERLRLNGEMVYLVPPLSVPDPLQATNPETLTHSEAARVFVDRALAAQPSFQVNNQNAPAVAEICYRLDGIPLAIELAAARVRSLPVEKIAERLGDRFRILTGGDRTGLPRHQTLRALIDWSYDLLTTPEQSMLQRLSVFAGGWTLEAAEVVCAGGEVNTLDVLDLLSNLVEKSLVRLTPETGRYGMLDTIGKYATDQLNACGTANPLLNAHYQYFLSLADNISPLLRGSDHNFWLQRMEDEHDNLRAAIQWTLDSGLGDEALHLCFVMGRFWHTGYFSEGRAWLEKALTLQGNASRRSQAEGLFLAGQLALDQRDLEVAARYIRESLDIARVLEYDEVTALGLLLQAALIHGLDETSAQQMLEEALAIYQKLGDKAGMSIVLLNLGVQSKEDLLAQQYYTQSLTLSRETEELWCMASSLNNLGVILYCQGDLDSAQGLFQEALDIQRRLRSKIDIANVLGNLGLIAIQREDAARSRELETESLTIRRTIGNLLYLADNISGLASVLRLEGQLIQAAQLQGFVAALHEQIEAGFDTMEQADYDRTSVFLEAILGVPGYQQAFETGRSMTLEQAFELVREQAES